MTRVGLSQLTSRPFVEVLETRAGEFKQIAQSLTRDLKPFLLKAEYFLFKAKQISFNFK